MKVKRLYHKRYWENLDSIKEVKSEKRTVLPVPPGYQREQPTSHIRLVKGVYVCNPHPKVLCPTLIGGNCRKEERPKLLIRHQSVPNLQLWQCLGCKDFLLRVEA